MKSHGHYPLSMKGCFNVRFRFLQTLLFILPNLICSVRLFSTLSSLKDSNIELHLKSSYTRYNYPPSSAHLNNSRFTCYLCNVCICLVISYVLYMLLLIAGDVHQNPGPNSRTTSTSSTSSTFSMPDLSGHISFVHYNVQSLLPKLDQLYSELKDFDILAFSETWLNKDLPSSEILLDSYKEPERKDRDDNHGGVSLYVKNNIFHQRRHDLEIIGVECIWIELVIANKHVLLGLFYRPPNTTTAQHASILDSIHLAIDSGIQDVIVTGDFNLNVRNPTSAAKIRTICEQFSLSQIIDSPTNFTESSESIIDLIFTSRKTLIHSSGVSDPFLDQNVRYHCPIYGALSFQKPKHS